MNDAHVRDKTCYSIYVIIGFLPFLIFYWMVPFLSDVTIGNDYIKFSISHQLELLFSLKSGSFPLYMPGFASGSSSSALTLGQIFHPLSKIASIMPGYWDGKAIEWNTLLKLLSLGLTHLVLFAFLKKLKLNNLFSFLLSFIALYNLRLIDLFRHGAPMEAYSGYLILCSVIGFHFINPSKWIWPLCIIGSTYLLICSGHPEEMYYGMLGAGLFTFVAPYYLNGILPDKEVNFRIALRFWLRTGFYFSLGMLLSSVFILPFYLDFISMNVDRVGQSYAWADQSLDPVIGTVNNYLLPLRSQANSAFGGSSLFIMIAILPVLRFFRVKMPRFVWIIWGLLLVIFLHMQGSRTPVHRLVWEYLPFASSIRDAGRISIIMPFFMMMLLAWMIKIEPLSVQQNRLSVFLKPSSILALTASLLLVVYYLLCLSGYYLFESSAFMQLFYLRYDYKYSDIFFVLVELATVVLGVGSLLAFAFYSLRNNLSRILGIFLVVATVLQLGIVIKYGAGWWIERKTDSPTFEEMQQQKISRLDYRYYPGYGLQSSIVNKQLTNSFVEPFLGKIFTQVISVNDQEEAYTKMQEQRLPQQAFIERYSAEESRKISEGARHMKEGNVNLLYSSFNRLQFHVSSEAPAIFGLSYPYTGNWRAWINKQRVDVYRANGAAHAIEIPKGESVIEFRYWSWALFWGMVFSCVTFAVIGLFVCFRALHGSSRFIGVVIILIISTGGFSLWYNSLYSGENMNTAYSWFYAAPLKTPNLAYGKKNWLASSTISSSWGARERELYSGRFVDGDIGPDSGFTTRLCDSPAWFIDLFRLEKIKTIVLYKSGQNPGLVVGPLNVLERIGISSAMSDKNSLVNVSPLNIALSDDGNKWNIATSILLQPNSAVPARIVFERPPIARYIKIMASGESRLSFDEIEAYGPEDHD